MVAMYFHSCSTSRKSRDISKDSKKIAEQALDAAKESNRIAKQALSQSERLFIEENRPWLLLEPERIKDTRQFLNILERPEAEDGKDRFLLAYAYKIKNVGQQTATDLIMTKYHVKVGAAMPFALKLPVQQDPMKTLLKDFVPYEPLPMPITLTPGESKFMKQDMQHSPRHND